MNPHSSSGLPLSRQSPPSRRRPRMAQAYPTKPITLVVPFAAGGPTDVVARVLGAAMTRTLGQSVLIENKTGAGGTIAAAARWHARSPTATPS